MLPLIGRDGVERLLELLVGVGGENVDSVVRPDYVMGHDVGGGVRVRRGRERCMRGKVSRRTDVPAISRRMSWKSGQDSGQHAGASITM